MGTGDGAILGATKILDNGPDDSRLNIVLIAEGFRDTEQADFDNLCQDFINELQAEPGYPAIGGAINVHRLNVRSTDSGADDPAECPVEPGDGTVAATFFDATFCTNGVHRCLTPDWNAVLDALNDNIPQWHAGAVVVNTPKRGGCARSSLHLFATGLGANPGESWIDVALHELGHAAFGLADEYQTWLGCDSGETDRDNYVGPEPIQPNITTVSTLATLKWRDLVTPEVPIPTMGNPDCSQCDERPNVLDSDRKIGLFEGAGYFHCGMYRPAYTCRMRKSSEPFCDVCVGAIAKRLGEFITPTPRMDVVTGNGSLLLSYGNVSHGLTMYRSFEVRNRRDGFPGPLRVTLGPPTGSFTYAPGTVLNFTLPAPVNVPHTWRPVFVAFTSTNVGGPVFNGSLHVTTPDDPANPDVIVDLAATAVPPPPVDTVLVFDRSGSMSEPTGVPGKRKVDLAIEAAQLYISLIKDNDRIGLSRFNNVANDPGDIVLNMELVGPPGSGRANALAALTAANLNPAGNTSIGGGILLGSKVLDGAASNSRALIVLTDGIQNTAPDIPAASATVSAKMPRQRVFAIGLGLNQLEDKLVQIASVTNGVAQITGDLVGYKEFLLHKLYVQILSDVSDEAFVKDPLGIVMPGDKRSTPIDIGEIDVAADFIIVFRPTPAYPKYINIWLEAPDGTIVRPSDAGSLPNVDYFSQPSHAFFRWVFPAFPGRPESHIGRWRFWVENFVDPRHVSGWNPASVNSNLPFYYSVMCKARSNLLLGGHLIQSSYSPGSTMTVVLEPTLFALPVSLSAPPQVHVVRPDNVTRNMTLTLGASGQYRGDYTDTPVVGPYHFSTEVIACTPAAHPVTRFRQLTGLIFLRRPPGQDDPGGGGHPGGGGQPGGGGPGGLDEADCKEGRELIRRLAEILERCCRHDDPRKPATVARSPALLLEDIRRLIDEN